MPTYEYKCDACGHAFEQFQSITADPIRRCPACKKLKVKRLIGTGAGLLFKGSGFYITDYRDQSYKDKAKADSGSAETKPETTTTAAGDASKPAGDSKPAEPGPAAAPKAESKPAASDAQPKTASTSAAKRSSRKSK
jgi:putative FmdB family regulatory protein